MPGTLQTCCRRYERVRGYSESLWGKSPDTGQRLPWRSANVAGSSSRAVQGGEARDAEEAEWAEPRDWVTVFVIGKDMQVARLCEERKRAIRTGITRGVLPTFGVPLSYCNSFYQPRGE